jgi:hypothetical protein
MPRRPSRWLVGTPAGGDEVSKQMPACAKSTRLSAKWWTVAADFARFQSVNVMGHLSRYTCLKHHLVAAAKTAAANAAGLLSAWQAIIVAHLRGYAVDMLSF